MIQRDRFGVLTAGLAVSSILMAAMVQATAPAGGEFQVNTVTTSTQYLPSVGIDSSGGFVVVWDNLATGNPTGQRYDSNGAPIGGEFTIATNALRPRIAMRPTGEFVAVWTNGDVFARRFAADGTPVGGDIQVNTFTAGFQGQPTVDVSGSGGFVVAWTSYGQDGTTSGVFGQRFDSSGGALGGEFQVEQFTTGKQYQPSIGVDAAGDFMVVWSDPDRFDVRGARFSSGGARLGGEFGVTSYTTLNALARIAMNDDGSAVVVWKDHNERDGFANGIFGRRFASNGSALGEFQVNTNTYGGVYLPAVATDRHGNFVVAWNSNDGYSVNWDMRARQFLPDGSPRGPQFEVNTYTTDQQEYGAVALSASGKFVVTWFDDFGEDGDGRGVFGQRYDPLPRLLERNVINLAVVRNGGTLTSATPDDLQSVSVPGGVAWTASSDQPFVTLTQTAGVGSGGFSVQIVNAAGLPTVGSATATVTVSAPGGPALAEQLTVKVTVYAPSTTSAAVGSFDLPLNNATGVAGAIPVTGWALDDVGVSSVELWRAPVAADPPGAIAPNGKVFIANAVFVSGQRPDIEQVQPDTPLNYRAAWGYMLLTNFLPSGVNPVGGNGAFTLYAIVYDVDGHQTMLGSKTITVDNANGTKPFGTINTPAQGAQVSGGLDNFGWALTPGTATIPTNGSTVLVFVDGVQVGNAQYNLPRTDIQTLFPGYTNSNGPVGVFHIDTTTLVNGLHTIFWIVSDDQARADGIGSRYFTVLN